MNPSDLTGLFDQLNVRIRALEVNERSEVTGGVESFTVATLGAAGQAGRMRYATDGRKTGEGPGAGTGVVAYDDGIAWRRVDDSTTVAA